MFFLSLVTKYPFEKVVVHITEAIRDIILLAVPEADREATRWSGDV